ncbi:hypothetical protein IWX58_004962 [Rubrivivax gelatinosus]|nr:hypothetical protein [Rubrivivax gelatinosus]
MALVLCACIIGGITLSIPVRRVASALGWL